MARATFNHSIVRGISLFIIFSGLYLQAYSQNSFKIEYFGNMGVAISRNDSVIFVDAFHSFYREEFMPTPAGKLDDVLDRRSPYKHTIAMLVTHYHHDHSDASFIEKVLRIDPSANLICGGQVWNQLDTTDDKIMNQVEKIPDEQHLTVVAGIRILSQRIWHINHLSSERYANTENFYYLIEWAGLRFLHLGDAELVDRNFEQLKAHRGTIDYLMVPDWFVSTQEGTELIDKYLGPRVTIVLHIDPNDKFEKSASKNMKYKVAVFSKDGDQLLTSK